MTGLSRNVVRDMTKILTRQKMQLHALDYEEEIPDDRQDVMDLPHLFKPTSAGLHDAARTLRANPLPDEEPGIPVPGVFGPVDRQPTQEEIEAGLARVDPGPHRVRPLERTIDAPEILERREQQEADAADRKEERPERRTRSQDRRTRRTQPKADAKTTRGRDKDVTEQDKQHEQLEAQEAQERQRRIDEAEADKKRLEEQTKREQELSRQANPQQQQQAPTTTTTPQPKKAQGR